MVSILIYVITTYAVTVGVCAFTEKKAEETLPSSVVTTVMLLYVFGLLDKLKYGLIFLFASTTLIYVFSVIHVIRYRKIKFFLRQVISCPILCMIFSMAFLTLGIHGKLFSVWDEFSHWGDVIKGMTDANALNSNSNAMSIFASYPPGMQLFQYLLQKIHIFVGGGFSEWRAYFSYDLFLLSFIAPVLGKIEYRNAGKAVTLLMCTMLTMTVFFNDAFSSLYIDVSLSCVFACGFFLIMTVTEPDWIDFLNVLSCCAILSILKDVGIVFSVFLVITLIVIKGKKSAVLSGIIYSFAPWLTWKINVKVNNAYEVFPLKYDIRELINVLLGKGAEYRRIVLHRFPQTLIARTLPLGNLGGNLSYLLLLIITGLLSAYSISRLNMQYKRWYYRIIIPTLLMFYTIGLCITYMFQYTEYEAVNLMSFERYLNIPLCSAWMIIVYCWTKKLYDDAKIAKLFVVFLLCFIICPWSAINGFFSSSERSRQIRSRYTVVEEKINRIEGINNIFVLSQEDNGLDLFVLHYLCRPNVVRIDEPYSVGPAFYEGDIWSKDKSYEELKSILLNDYDYLVVMGVNEYFITNYNTLFDDEIVINGLYKIDKTDGVLRLAE